MVECSLGSRVTSSITIAMPVDGNSVQCCLMLPHPGKIDERPTGPIVADEAGGRARKQCESGTQTKRAAGIIHVA